jgi:hypothetical protein
LKYYLHIPKVVTNHLHSLIIETSTGTELSFPSLQRYTTTKLLDYHRFSVVRPSTPTITPFPIASSATSEAQLARNIIHQHYCHGSDEVLDLMCQKQSILSLPK